MHVYLVARLKYAIVVYQRFSQFVERLLAHTCTRYNCVFNGRGVYLFDVLSSLSACFNVRVAVPLSKLQG